MSDDSDGQRQCRRGVTVDVELDAAMALADMAGVGPAGEQQQPVRHAPPPPPAPTTHQEDEEELASTRLSLELGKVGIQASPCSSSSSAGGGQHHQQAAYHQQQQVPAAAQAPATGYGPRPRHALTEAEKEAKRLRRVLANRESARQTILRRQAIRDELARKVADLSSQNESMKKEKDMVMQEYLSLKEANKQLKEQVATRTAKKAAAAAVTATMPTQQAATAESLAAAAASTASPPASPPRPGFLYTAAGPAPVVPVPYVWGSWPPGAGAGYEHRGSPPPLCLQPCAWYYPVVAADPRGSPSSAPAPVYAQPAAAAFQDPRGAVAVAEPAGSGGSPAGGGGATGEEDTDDDPCSLTLGLDVVDKRSAPVSIFPAGPCGVGGAAQSDRDKVATAAEARKRRKELTKLKHMHSAARPGGEQW